MTECLNCKLRRSARNRINVSGDLPCDILFILDPPDETSDILGKHTGRVFETLKLCCIRANIDTFKLAFVSYVQCRPCDSRTSKTRAATLDEILACSEQLNEVVKKANAKQIVFVGSDVTDKLKCRYKRAISIIHPLSVGSPNTAQGLVLVNKLRMVAINLMEDSNAFSTYIL